MWGWVRAKVLTKSFNKRCYLGAERRQKRLRCAISGIRLNTFHAAKGGEGGGGGFGASGRFRNMATRLARLLKGDAALRHAVDGQKAPLPLVAGIQCGQYRVRRERVGLQS